MLGAGRPSQMAQCLLFLIDHVIPFRFLSEGGTQHDIFHIAQILIFASELANVYIIEDNKQTRGSFFANLAGDQISDSPFQSTKLILFLISRIFLILCIIEYHLI